MNIGHSTYMYMYVYVQLPLGKSDILQVIVHCIKALKSDCTARTKGYKCVLCCACTCICMCGQNKRV